MEKQITENPLVAEWLAEKRSQSTRDTYSYKLRIFLDYFGINPEELLKLSPKEARTLALKFQNEQPEMPNNTVLSHLTAVGSFLEHHDRPIKWKRARVKPRPDVSSHVFSNGDLSKMFQVGDIRDKAMLSLACSLGWEISAFTKLKRKKIQDLIGRAKETEESYVYFRNVRQKTGVLRLGVLNPLALKYVDKWLQRSTPKKKEKINPTSEIFGLTDRGIQNRLKILSRRAGIKTTGDVRFHNIRKWTMSGLNRSGFNEFQIKFVLGKAIPMSDATYLQTLEQEVRERYPSAYENYLNLETSVPRKAVDAVSKDLETKTEEIEALKMQLQELTQRFEDSYEVSNGQTTPEEAIRIMKALMKRVQEGDTSPLRIIKKKKKAENDSS